MSDWGLMPDEINEKWTEERFACVFIARNERIRAANRASAPSEDRKPEPKRVSADEFFKTMNQTINVVNAGNA